MAKRRDTGLVRLIAHSVWHALFLALMVMVGGMLLTPSSAHAAPYTGNYQLDLQVTNGPFSYGGSTLPQFQATLTALNGTTLSSCTGSTFVTIAIDTEPGATWGSNSQSASGANTCVYTYVGEPPDWGHYATGLRTATAPATVSGQVVATGTATFMVNRISPVSRALSTHPEVSTRLGVPCRSGSKSRARTQTISLTGPRASSTLHSPGQRM